MLGKLVYLALATAITVVTGLGTSCSGPLGSGTAPAGDPYWLETIKHQGIAAYNSNPANYKVFRNVKDYGARGDGVTDDTAAINRAITEGSRCGEGRCASSTTTPALVYFPRGTYLVTAPIIPYYYTQLVGDAKNRPTILGAANFNGFALIDVNPYIPNGGGAQWYTNQNTFFRAIRNFVLDTRRMPASSTATALHWQVAQATALMNIDFQLSTAGGNNHQGLWMENGSGGFMNDLTFNGGKYALWVGNQQFTVRNVVITNSQTAVYSIWNWGWTFQGITIRNAQVGFDLATGGTTEQTQTVGAEAIIDAEVYDTPIFVRNSQPSNGKLAGSLVIDNAKLVNVPIAVGVLNGATVLAGGTKTISSWAQGNVYGGTNANPQFRQGDIPAPSKNALTDSSGKIFGKSRPQYANYATSQFVSVKSEGAKGDGRTDDTQAIKDVISKWAGCKIIFFDAGTYVVSSTITIPPDTQIVGEAWSIIAGTGSAFSDPSRPQVVVKVGSPGQTGTVEISDIIFSTIGPAGGAIVVEWNIKQSSPGSAGTWDTHIRLGGTASTNLEGPQCPTHNNKGPACMAAYLGLHLTPQSSGYFEAAWVWLADHDLDNNGGQGQISIYAGRGILSESQGPTWLVGTASEHFVIYQYSLVNAKQHYLGLIQTESPYFQPNPAPPNPFTLDSSFNDPSFPGGLTSSWALHVKNSVDITVFGAGLYSFFTDYTQGCLTSRTCQTQLINIDSASRINIYSLSTVATTYMLSVNGNGVIRNGDNNNGFAQTATFWGPTL